jgi:16S rRNA (uracil1498-N3)-methyltransferase
VGIAAVSAPPRIFVAAPFASGHVVVLPAHATRHVQVLRLQPGGSVTLFNGADGADWPSEIVSIGRNRVEVRLGAPVAIDHELVSHVTLALGVPANDRMDALVEKAGELGAAAIQPLVSARSVLRLSGERAEARRRHWQAVAAAASEQCGRARVADVLPIAPLAPWLAALGGGAPLVRRFVLSTDPSASDAADALDASVLRGARIVVLSGPEGGLEPGEESAAIACGFVRVNLGPRILRADTAPLAWLAWFAMCGRAELRALPAS